MNIVLVCGAPGSGKSTLTKELISKGYVSLNRDSEGGTISSLLPKMEELLKNGNNIVLDNLFTTIESRKPFIELAKKYGDISCKLMDTSIEDSQFNVVQRAINIIGKFPTPEEIKKTKHPNIFPPAVLFKYRKEYQKPTIDEGFSNIEIIKFIRKDNPDFKQKALILDYDGCLRECVGGNGKYPISEDQIKILPRRKEILEDYKNKGYILLGISNQSGIAKKELTYNKAIELFDFTNKQLDLDIDYKFCPHQSAPVSCFCRKPQVGLFVDFMIKYKLSRKDCIFVGDLKTDETFAKRCGMKFFYAESFFKGN